MPRIRTLLATSDLTMGEFHCPPEDPAWREENTVGNGCHVVFPGTGVRIVQDGREAVVADPNSVVLYEDHQTYRRELLSERGDHCRFLIPSAPLARWLVDAPDDERPVRFPAPSAPADARAYLLQHTAARYLAEAEAPDPEAVREPLYEALRRVVGRVAPRSWPRRRPSTALDHREAVGSAKAYLTLHAGDRILLDDVAAHVHRSPFHLARIFREHTGSSVHGYLTHVRLRAALQRLDDGTDLATIALEAGFSSHAHFSGAFRRAFGITPSTARRCVRTGRELSRILEAAAPVTS